MIFDSNAFYKRLYVTRIDRQMSWKDISSATGISCTTLSRLAQGRLPNGADMAVLMAWAGLDPREFVDTADALAILAYGVKAES